MTINKRNLNLGQWYSNAPKQEEIQETEFVKAEEVQEEVIEKSEVEKAFEDLEGIQKSEEETEDEIKKAESDEAQEAEKEEEVIIKSQTEEFQDIMKSFESGQLKNNWDQTVDSKEEALQIALEKSDLQGALGFTSSGKVVFDDLSKSEDFLRQDHIEASQFFKSQMSKTPNSIQVADLIKKSNFHQSWADIKLGRK